MRTFTRITGPAAALLRAVGSNASLYGSGGPQDGNFDSLLVGVPGIQRRLGQRMWVGAHIETVDQGQNRHYRSIRQQAANFGRSLLRLNIPEAAFRKAPRLHVQSKRGLPQNKLLWRLRNLVLRRM